MGDLLPIVRLKPHEGRRLDAGHRWVFSNEIDTIVARLGGTERPVRPEPGALVVVEGDRGRRFGTAHYNPHTLIAARLLGGIAPPKTAAEEQGWLETTIGLAVRHRAARLASPAGCARLVHSDADGLPGLVVDRYGPLVSFQLLTAGMERLRSEVIAALAALPGVRTLFESSRGPFRALEGLGDRTTWVAADEGAPRADDAGGGDAGAGDAAAPAPPALPVAAEVSLGSGLAPLRLAVDPVRGQKTGEFLDQVDNRAWAVEWLRREPLPHEEPTALDLYCYSGLWAVALATGVGARATGVDSSGAALEAAARHAALNGVAERCAWVEHDAMAFLQEAIAEERRYDVVVVDPPAFAKSRKTASQALRKYEELNTLALRLVAPGGALVTCSCSHHVPPDNFAQVVARAARRARRRAWIVAERAQSSDHPILLGMDETRYLKLVALRVLD